MTPTRSLLEPKTPAAIATLTLVRRGQDFTQRQLAVLWLLGANPTAPGVRELSGALKVPPPSMTRAVDRLTAAGLAVRKRDPQDARLIRIRITESGKKLLNQLETTR